jgi:hypothetical protein
VSSPLFTFLIALAFLGETLTAQALAGMVAPRSGCCSSASRAPRPAAVARQGRHRGLRSAWLVGFASSAAYAVGNVMRGAGVRAWDEPIAGALIGAVAGIACHFAFTRGTPRHAARLARGASRRTCAVRAVRAS